MAGSADLSPASLCLRPPVHVVHVVHARLQRTSNGCTTENNSRWGDLHPSLTRKTFIRVHPDGNPAGVDSVAGMTRSHCRSPVFPPYFRTILITKCAAFQSCSLQTTHSLSVCVYNIGVFCLYRKINATTPSLSGLFKFPKTFRTTFLSVLAEEAITKITAVFSFLHRDSPLVSVSTGGSFKAPLWLLLSQGSTFPLASSAVF